MRLSMQTTMALTLTMCACAAVAGARTVHTTYFDVNAHVPAGYIEVIKKPGPLKMRKRSEVDGSSVWSAQTRISVNTSYDDLSVQMDVGPLKNKRGDTISNIHAWFYNDDDDDDDDDETQMQPRSSAHLVSVRGHIDPHRSYELHVQRTIQANERIMAGKYTGELTVVFEPSSVSDMALSNL